MNSLVLMFGKPKKLRHARAFSSASLICLNNCDVVVVCRECFHGFSVSVLGICYCGMAEGQNSTEGTTPALRGLHAR